MKLLKSVLLAFSLALSLGSFSTAAVACEDGRTCFGPAEAIDIVLGHIAEGMKSVENGENGPTVNVHVKAALRASKEINVSDRIDVKRAKANGHLKKARSAFKKSDMQGGQAHLGMAEKAFTTFKKMI
ncbi:MAG: hypothetical protein ABGX71_11645 [Methyloprofundus sp.]|uniref:hypothetical protein n=1 Tax=Methyloprofundus sp. TaxID=2020875 RepID=UPI001A156156|nr:hypothetical protein [Methyloprofundus sp.]HIL77681.1 hypothetical protein [Methylococcales bacterium]